MNESFRCGRIFHIVIVIRDAGNHVVSKDQQFIINCSADVIPVNRN